VNFWALFAVGPTAAIGNDMKNSFELGLDHHGRKLGGLSAGDFADLSRRVAGYAPGPGRLVLFLEGGYDLEALTTSVGASLAALADVPYRPEPATSGGPGAKVVEAARQQRARLNAL